MIDQAYVECPKCETLIPIHLGVSEQLEDDTEVECPACGGTIVIEISYLEQEQG